ncbi:hypothetical protein PL81_16555 [Streptomyces sp. RSD-27]|nr:hypothetical protein PL81_16555 [Streptomyces sp. RSD-27]
MSVKRSSHPAASPRRAAAEPAGPWQDFDELMERMVELFEAGRPTRSGAGSEAPPERSPRP